MRSSSPIFFFFFFLLAGGVGGRGEGGNLLSFAFAFAFAQAQAQDVDGCLGCAIVKFFGDEAIDATIFGTNILKGAFEGILPAAGGGDPNNKILLLDPSDTFLDEPPLPPQPQPQPNVSPPPAAQLIPEQQQQNANTANDADIELINVAPSLPPIRQEDRCYDGDDDDPQPSPSVRVNIFYFLKFI